nr:hypothetical protein [Enterobacter hormaechei]
MAWPARALSRSACGKIAELDSTELAGIIDMALHAPDMANMPAPVTAGALYSAIARVEHQAGLL